MQETTQLRSQIETYYDQRDFIHFSKLKDLSLHPRIYKQRYIDNIERPETFSLKIGSVVHCLVLCPELFEEYYLVANIKENESMFRILERAGEIYKNMDLETFDSQTELIYDTLIEVVLDLDLFKNIKKKETFIKKLDSFSILDTLKIKLANPDKILMSAELYQQAEEIANNVLLGKFTQKYFRPSLIHLKEFPIYWEKDTSFGKQQCKILVDLIVIDTENKTIQPIDLKTTFDSPSSFKKSILKYRYDLQAAFYTEGVREWMKNTEFKDYTLLSFKSIVESTNYPGSPLIYDYANILDKGITGFKYKEDFYKGYEQLLQELIWHTANDEWNYKYEEYENKGEILLTID